MKHDWFFEFYKKVRGNGETTSVWHDPWLTNSPLCKLFPRLYAMLTKINCSIRNMGSMVDGVWSWDLFAPTKKLSC